jgi:hypothetical protein
MLQSTARLQARCTVGRTAGRVGVGSKRLLVAVIRVAVIKFSLMAISC